MTLFQFQDFKNICYQIEGLLNRSWTVKELSGENYPKSFYYAIFDRAGFSQKQIALLCNRHKLIFALVDTSQIDSLDNIDKGFIESEEIGKALNQIMEANGFEYNLLKPEVLYLAYYNKQEYFNKLESIDTKTQNIRLTAELLNPELFNYTLPHGDNIGNSLFHFFDD